jgi:hypothetical protein
VAGGGREGEWMEEGRKEEVTGGWRVGRVGFSIGGSGGRGGKMGL